MSASSRLQWYCPKCTSRNSTNGIFVPNGVFINRTYHTNPYRKCGRCYCGETLLEIPDSALTVLRLGGQQLMREFLGGFSNE